jgi:hypothetical protein
MIVYMAKGHKPHELEFMPVLSNRQVIHYTCNAPHLRSLTKNGIVCLGDKFNCVDEREVLGIPIELYLRKGFLEEIFSERSLLSYNTEILLRNLD